MRFPMPVYDSHHREKFADVAKTVENVKQKKTSLSLFL